MQIMKIGIIGGGGVAQVFGAGLMALGHDVQLGIRRDHGASGSAW
jgi:ketopantoate reductase